VLLIFSEAIENLKIAALIDSLVSDDLYQISTNNFHADEKVDGTIQKAIEEFLNLYDHRIDSYLYFFTSGSLSSFDSILAIRRLPMTS
jgi:hypothetical protein